MKLSYTVVTPEARSDKILAYRGDLSRIFKQLAEIGYDGVELMVRDPALLDVHEIRDQLEQYGLVVPAIGTGLVYVEDKLSFTDPDPFVRQATVERCEQVIRFAAELDSMVIIGKVRGRYVSGMEKTVCVERARECFEKILQDAERMGVTITLEPQSRVGTDFLNTVAECIVWINFFDSPNFKLMCDTFHMNIEEACMSATLIEASPYLVHVHLAENNRLPPGQGSLNFPEILRVLQALQFNGFVSMETLQVPNSVTAATKAFRYITTLLDAMRNLT